MYLDKAKKQEIFGQYGKTATDTVEEEGQMLGLYPKPRPRAKRQARMPASA